MKKLTLIRHAKSDWNSSAASDFDRPLNKRGQKAAPLMGERLVERGYQGELLISSPAKRARQTAICIAEQLDYPENGIEYKEEIYEAGLRTLVNLVANLSDDRADVVLIGHNPGLSELGQWLTPEAPDWLPTCGLLELELPLGSWSQVEEGCATLRQYDYPKKPV